MNERGSIPTDPRRRRSLLAGGASAAVAAGLAAFGGSVSAQNAAGAPAAAATPPAGAGGGKPLPAYASWKDASALIVHSSNTLETRRSAFGTSVITPSDRLYVRNNLPPPPAEIVANPDVWEIGIEGVRNPRRLTLADLKSMGLDTVATVLQCSGNGRGYFPSKPSGTPWTVGAAGCVIWSGVPVYDVVQALGGVADGMVYMTGTGGEKIPEGIDPNTVLVERSVPLAAMADALLAWELNGEPLPLAHGGPLRLVVPGYTGVNSIKYVKQLAFTPEQSAANIQRRSYRMTPPGQKTDTSDPSVWQMSPKSWINSPLPGQDRLQQGKKVVIEGIAMGGMQPVAKVEVSTDGGASWKTARLLGPDLGRYAWRQFALETELPAGSHTLASRVTDAKGRVQEENRVENSHGYSNSSWRDHALTVQVA